MLTNVLYLGNLKNKTMTTEGLSKEVETRLKDFLLMLWIP